MNGFYSIIKDKQIGDFHIQELAIQENKGGNRLILKVKKQDNLPDIITILCNMIMQGNNFIAPIQMYSMQEIFPPKHKVYITDVKEDVKINDLMNVVN